MNPPFEERAVAFLDILGFTPLMHEAEKQPEGFTELFGLRILMSVLTMTLSTVLWFNDAMRTEELLKGIGGKRLTYRRTDAEEVTA